VKDRILLAIIVVATGLVFETSTRHTMVQKIESYATCGWCHHTAVAEP
jgi:hypothetical protein